MALTSDATGHPVLDGARWHTPKPGRPTECMHPGCDYLLGQRPAPVLLDDDPNDPNDAVVALDQAA